MQTLLGPLKEPYIGFRPSWSSNTEFILRWDVCDQVLGDLKDIFCYLNSISYNTSAVFSVSRSSSGCQSEQYRLVDIQY